ncbi:hypothetical protein V6N13_039481 [Hibiscus sabdariffa]
MLYLPTRHSLNGSEIETSDPEHPIPGFVIPTCVLPSAVFSKDGGYTVYVKVDERFKVAKDINKLVMPDEMEKAIGMVMNGESEVTERIC